MSFEKFFAKSLVPGEEPNQIPTVENYGLKKMKPFYWTCFLLIGLSTLAQFAMLFVSNLGIDFSIITAIMVNLIVASALFYILRKWARFEYSRLVLFLDIIVITYVMNAILTYFPILKRYSSGREHNLELLFIGASFSWVSSASINLLKSFVLKALTIVLSFSVLFSLWWESESGTSKAIPLHLIIISLSYSFILFKDHNYIAILAKCGKLIQIKYQQAKISDKICEGILIITKEGQIIYGNLPMKQILHYNETLEKKNIKEIVKERQWLFTKLSQRSERMDSPSTGGKTTFEVIKTYFFNLDSYFLGRIKRLSS